MYGHAVPFGDLAGKTLVSITGGVGDDEMILTTDTGERYKLFHDRGCCESVSVEDITGNLDDLIGSPLLRAEETTSGENPEGVKMAYQDSFTWTFYHLSTAKGTVTIRWYGESNGWYSESVDCVKLPDAE